MAVPLIMANARSALVYVQHDETIYSSSLLLGFPMCLLGLQRFRHFRAIVDAHYRGFVGHFRFGCDWDPDRTFGPTENEFEMKLFASCFHNSGASGVLP